MARVLIEQKMEALRRCVERVAGKCPDQKQDLMDDPDLQDIVVLNLTRAVQLCVDIAGHIIATSAGSAPGTMGQAFSTLAQLHIFDEATANRMKNSVGVRNVAVHNYEDVEWEIVHAIYPRWKSMYSPQRPFLRAFVSKCSEMPDLYEAIRARPPGRSTLADPAVVGDLLDNRANK